MDIRILEKAASEKIREHTPEEAEKFMARVRTNLFDLLCHSDKARAELPIGLDLGEYGGKEAVERAIGKAVVNLLALAAVFGVRTGGVILRELGFASEVESSTEATGNAHCDNGSSSDASEGDEAGLGDEKAGSAGEHLDAAPTTEDDGGKGDDNSGYRQRLDKAGTVEERTAIWKKIQVDRGLDSKTRAELYQHMASLNKQEAA